MLAFVSSRTLSPNPFSFVLLPFALQDSGVLIPIRGSFPSSPFSNEVAHEPFLRAPGRAIVS